MLNHFAEQNEIARKENADDFMMPDELEKACKTFVQACIDYRISKAKNGKGDSPDFITSLMNDKLVTLTNLTGLSNKATTTLAREVVIDHFNQLAEKQASEMDSLDRVHY
ncbi:hypothetical protein FCV60_19340 [Vibrio sp. F13]|uniref:hypothetical protein n=1 Tax=unclassified Vibrio TaxID=2614977 RepID=UPI0010BDBB38|nr:hypothetical protein [Vibrio sp. F13]TKF42933.1 hypothetical protein FCV49_15185 [Vibrio sp. F13]TKF50835.1 hypothetical protein FCV60_19340 [Vibrio sp. F13]TKG06274.1 hypothetical protein FCV67_15350 [Vibrio sp. F13]